MRNLRRLLWVVVVLTVAYSAWVIWSRKAADREWRAKQDAREVARYKAGLPPPPAAGPKILQFYASQPVIRRGERVLLCYGVANAKTVRIVPAVEDITPSFNRCIEARPARSAAYTLTATAADGKTVSASLKVAVDAHAPPAVADGEGPHILYFRVKETRRDGERLLHALCFATRHSTEVRLDPPVLPPLTTAIGCFWVAPENTTTYTIVARDAEGRSARKSLTVSRSGT
ncbi:MAG TPA: hypothetical protein VFL57_01950 [Bryobacteraceae bacterium]|nr:hypothetical protein [Bryobacteraceae bacterium]